MNTGLLVLRIIHIGAGVVWAGTMIFFATFLEPALREAGPDGGRVLQGMGRRHYLTVMPVLAVLTILTGVDLIRRVSGNFQPAWFGTPAGLTLTVGSVLSVIAFLIGILYMRPAARRLAQLRADAGGAGAPSPEAGRLQRRLTTGARTVAVLLGIAVVTMAVARYL